MFVLVLCSHPELTLQLQLTGAASSEQDARAVRPPDVTIRFDQRKKRWRSSSSCRRRRGICQRLSWKEDGQTSMFLSQLALQVYARLIWSLYTLDNSSRARSNDALPLEVSTAHGLDQLTCTLLAGCSRRRRSVRQDLAAERLHLGNFSRRLRADRV